MTQDKIQVEYKKLIEIKPYDKNPRKNDKAVDVVAKSIKEYGFINPIIIDKDNIIVAGHTRYKAAQKLGLTEAPIIYASNLTSAQIKAFRIIDNKSNEYAQWDDDLLKIELDGLKELNFDIDLTGFTEIELQDKEYKEQEFDENIEIKYICPKCNYGWS